MIPGSLGIRVCPICLEPKAVLSCTGLIAVEFVTLACNHRLTLSIERPSSGAEGAIVHSSNFSSTPTTKDCPLCGEVYTSYAVDDFAKLCWDCRREQKAANAADVIELLEVIKQYTSDQLASIRKQIKEGREAAKPQYQRSFQTPAAPKIDAEKVAAAVRSMTAYGVLAHDLDSVDKPTAYVIAKNGLFHVSHSDLADIISVPKEVAGVQVELKPGISLKIPRVPFRMLSQTVAFFKAVEKKSGSEALVQIWWNTVEKAHHIHCPDQTVSGGSVNHRSDFDRDQARTPEGAAIWLHVMDIHSHNTMSAFWSGTDNGDEMKAPEGRMFGVIGKMRQAIPDWKWRIRSRDGFIDLNIDDLFEVDLKAVVPFTVTWDVIMGCLRDAVKDPAKAATDGTLMLRCPVDPFKDATFPEEWMGMLSGRSHGTQAGGPTPGLHQVHGHGGSAYTPIPSYIFIKNTEGTRLDEYCMENGVPVPTGKSLEIIKGRG